MKVKASDLFKVTNCDLKEECVPVLSTCDSLCGRRRSGYEKPHTG